MRVRNPRFLLALVLSSTLAVSRPADSQIYGRWNWFGNAGLAQRYFDSSTNDDAAPSRRYNEGRIFLNLGLNGFILHPKIADFQVRTRLALTEVEGAFADNRILGIGMSLNGLPAGRYPFHLDFDHGEYDYADLSGDPISRRNYPDTVTTGNAGFWARGGLLRGLRGAIEGRAVDFLDKSAGRDTFNRQKLSWQRGRRFRHSLGFERRNSRYAFDGSSEDLLLRFEERAQLSEQWKWSSTLQGVQRTSQFSGPESTARNADFGNSFDRPFRTRDLFQVNLSAGISNFDSSDRMTRYQVGSQYNFAVDNFVLTPDITYQVDSRGSRETEALGLGFTTFWALREHRLRPSVRVSVRHGPVRTTDETTEVEDTRTGFGASGSIGYTRFAGLDHRLDLFGNRSEFRSEPRIDPDLPDLGLRDLFFSISDSYGGRYSVRREGRKRTFDLWLDGSRLTSDDNAIDGLATTLDRLAGTLEMRGRLVSLTASLGNTRQETERPESVTVPPGAVCVTRPTEGDVLCPSSSRPLTETVRSEYLNTTAWFTPYRFLDMGVSYATTFSDLEFAPDIDSTRLEVRFRFSLGLLAFEAWAYQLEESVLGGPLGTNRGFEWRIRRSFSGWLPIVSMPKRRGSIR